MKKWILRLLTFFAVICAFSLFSLKIVSGTGSSQKTGLEQAFSQMFRGEAKFESLKTFNIFPQFALEIEKLTISGIKDSKGMTADSLAIAFGPIDLIVKNRVIENFHLKNLIMAEGVFTPLELKLNDAGIYGDETKNTAQFKFTGQYGQQDLAGQIDMAMKSSFRPKYFFEEKNDFVITMGATQLSGKFSPTNQESGEITDLYLSAMEKNGSVECRIPAEKKISLSVFMKDILGQTATIKNAADLKNICDTLQK